jgi:ATP-dependent Clp protease ATP-binding subunit ClpA
VENPGALTQAQLTRQCRAQLVHPHGGHPPMLPEIVNRFTEILLFRELGDYDRVEIIALSILRLGEQYELVVRQISAGLLQETVNRLSVQNGVRDVEYSLESLFGTALAAFADENDTADVALSGSIDSIQVDPYTN